MSQEAKFRGSASTLSFKSCESWLEELEEKYLPSELAMSTTATVLAPTAMPYIQARLHLPDVHHSLFHMTYEWADWERLKTKALYDKCSASHIIC